MRGWIILFTLLTLAFLIPLSDSANEGSLHGASISGLAVFGTLAFICAATLIGRAKT